MFKEVQIKSDVLLTLIKTSGYDEEDIAKKLQISYERIKEGRLTYSQLKKLADVLKRPLVAFFSDEIPILKSPPDYRLNRDKKINPDVFLAQRRLDYLIKKLKKVGGIETFIPPFPLEISPIQLARQFRNYLNIDLIKNEKPEILLEKYKNIIEEKLNLIIIEHPLKPKITKGREVSDDVRAFSIYAELSGIVLNESDHPSVKLFSLFHEICHLLRRTSGLCSLEYEVEKKFKEELYCNRFAAEFLVPSNDIKEELKKYSIDTYIISEVMDNLSKIYGVSKQVILLRLLYLNYISPHKYNEFKKYLEEKGKEKQFGLRRWDKVFRNRVGNIVIKEAKRFLKENRISFYEALNILNVKAKYAQKFLYE